MTDDELLQKLEDLTINAHHHQLETLRSILLHNATVRYLQPFFKNAPLPLDHSTFTRLLPLSSYEDYVHYINLMADGKDYPFLSVDPLHCFFYRLLNPFFLSSFRSHHQSSSLTLPFSFFLLAFLELEMSLYINHWQYYISLKSCAFKTSEGFLFLGFTDHDRFPLKYSPILLDFF